MAVTGASRKIAGQFYDNGMLHINPMHPDFGAKGDNVTDDTAAIQACITAAQTLAMKMFLPMPSVGFKVSSKLVVNPTLGFNMEGVGRGSVIIPTAFADKIIQIGTGLLFEQNFISIKNFAIRAPVITSGQTGIGTDGVSCNGVHLEKIYTYQMDIGFDMQTAQFCTFKEISGSRGNIGLKLWQSIAGGGGNNNKFDSCNFCYNIVGVFCNGNSVYPMGTNEFANLVTHGNTCCGFCGVKQGSVTISNWAPEAIGSVASYVIDGFTVLNSTFHLDQSNIILPGYVHVSNTLNYVLRNGSQATFDGGGSATMRGDFDSTSFVTYSERPFWHYSGSATKTQMYTLRPPVYIINGQQSSFASEPRILETRAFINEACGDVLRGSVGGGTNVSPAYVNDPLWGWVMQFALTDATKQITLPTKDSNYVGIDTIVYAAFNFMSSDSTAQWSFDLGQSTANISGVIFEAGKWYRITLIGKLLFTPRIPLLTIKAGNAAAFAATAKTSRLHSFVSTDPRILATVVRENVFNPNEQPIGADPQDKGDGDVTLSHLNDLPTVFFKTALTANRIVTLPTYGGAIRGSPHKAKFRIVRSGLGAFTLAVKDGGTGTTLKTMPSATAAWSEFEYIGMPGNGGTWIQTGYAPL